MSFHLGGRVDEHGERLDGDDLRFDPSDLTTHGVIIGMTGSGKTGLGVIYLEEALRSGIPTLVLDPKGDMTNLLLTFPDLAPTDFRAWIDTAAAERAGRTPEEEAETVADRWRSGLASWELSGSDIADLRSRCGMTIYTPGSTSGVPLDVVGDLGAPALDWDTHAETLRDGIGGYVSGLLGLVDIDADPISSREHILIANLIEHAWRGGIHLDLATLLGWVVTPPIRKLGVFEIDSFFPERDRSALAMRLNGLLASPSFSAWMTGPPLDIDALLWRDGTPQAAIVYLAHLSEPERQFMVTAILSKLISWMRGQPGSSDLRILVYMDEVFGFVPPSARPPAKKPILTLMKQARAFGVGMLLSTQNPVDLDYKAMSNAGTWCIGRLQTERDKARVLEAVTAASGVVDVDAIDRRISGLGTRVFLLHSTRGSVPEAFTTRWAMSYLRGPMTRDEVASITPRVADTGDHTKPVPSTAPPTTSGTGAPEPSMPAVLDGVETGYLDPAAPWAHDVGLVLDGDHYEPIVTVEVAVHYDEARIDFDHDDVFEAIIEPTDALRPEDIRTVDHDDRDILERGDDLPHRATDVISDPTWFRSLERLLLDHLDRTVSTTVFRHRGLDLVSRPGEDLPGFEGRVARAAQDAADREMADRRSDFERRIRKARRDYDDALTAAEDAAEAVEAANTDAILGAGLDLLMGRRPSRARGSSRSARQRLRRAETRIERARDDYEELGEQLDDELARIAQAWEGATEEIEEIEVGLERDDLRIDRLRVVWVRR